MVLPATAFALAIISLVERYFAELSESCSLSGAPKPENMNKAMGISESLKGSINQCLAEGEW